MLLTVIAQTSFRAIMTNNRFIYLAIPRIGKHYNIDSYRVCQNLSIYTATWYFCLIFWLIHGMSRPPSPLSSCQERSSIAAAAAAAARTLVASPLRFHSNKTRSPFFHLKKQKFAYNWQHKQHRKKAKNCKNIYKYQVRERQRKRKRGRERKRCSVRQKYL